MTGIEPAPSVWKTEALPLSYIPIWLAAEADCAVTTLLHERDSDNQRAGTVR